MHNYLLNFQPVLLDAPLQLGALSTCLVCLWVNPALLSIPFGPVHSNTDYTQWHSKETKLITHKRNARKRVPWRMSCSHSQQLAPPLATLSVYQMTPIMLMFNVSLTAKNRYHLPCQVFLQQITSDQKHLRKLQPIRRNFRQNKWDVSSRK